MSSREFRTQLRDAYERIRGLMHAADTYAVRSELSAALEYLEQALWVDQKASKEETKDEQ